MSTKYSSETEISGKATKVFYERPSLDEWKNRVGVERMEKFLTDFVVRFSVLPACKMAGKVIDGEVEALKSKERNEARLADAVGLMEQIEREAVLDIFAFIPDERVQLPEELRPFKAQAESFLRQAEGNEAMKAKLIAKCGSADIISIARALKREADKAFGL